MKNAYSFEARLLDPDYNLELRANGEQLSKDIHAELDNDILSDKIKSSSGEPGEVFDIIHEHFPLERIKKMLDVEYKSFQNVDTFESLFSSTAHPPQASLIIMRARVAISLLSAMDPHALAISKKRRRESGGTISFPAGQAEYVILKGELRVRVWRMNAYDDRTDFASFETGLVADEPIILKAGDRLRQKDFESLEYLEHDKPCLYILTQMNDSDVPVDVALNPKTGEIKTVSSASSLSTRVQMQSTLMRMLQRKDAYETIEELLESEHHYVRWHTMRELLGLDLDRALPRLVKMEKEDPQPAVRRAASQALQLINTPVNA